MYIYICVFNIYKLIYKLKKKRINCLAIFEVVVVVGFVGWMAFFVGVTECLEVVVYLAYLALVAYLASPVVVAGTFLAVVGT